MIINGNGARYAYNILYCSLNRVKIIVRLFGLLQSVIALLAYYSTALYIKLIYLKTKNVPSIYCNIK